MMSSPRHTEQQHTLLFADDDPVLLKVMRVKLTNEGYGVVTASDGKIAQDLLLQTPDRFCAVLLDWQMPSITGIELLKWIKKQPLYENIPVIMVTGMVTKEHIREGINAGAFYYVTKPFDDQILVSIINAAVKDYQYKQSLIERLRQSQNPFSTLVEGVFRFRTIEEGEQLVLWLANACPSPRRAAELSEIIINAVEHGNLGIGYDEKTRLLATNSWSKEIQRRLALPDYAGKYVTLRVERQPDSITVYVEDEGDGFDYEKYMHFDETRVFHSHGRGIALASVALQVEFLGKGNKVRVRIPL